jgi:hypothetical protein
MVAKGASSHDIWYSAADKPDGASLWSRKMEHAQ